VAESSVIGSRSRARFHRLPRVLRLFQLTPSHTEEALALVAQAFTTVVSIAVAYTVVQRDAVEWPRASELLPVGAAGAWKRRSGAWRRIAS
jgi:hypothetical protein